MYNAEGFGEEGGDEGADARVGDYDADVDTGGGEAPDADSGANAGLEGAAVAGLGRRRGCGDAADGFPGSWYNLNFFQRMIGGRAGE